MTVTRVLLARIAAVGVCIVALAGMANAQISGRVVGPDLSPIDSAHVEVWSSYPDGSKLTAVFGNMNGEFTVGGLPAGTYDVRVWKGKATDIYYPAYAMDVPYPLAGELLLVLVAAPTILTAPWSCDYSDPTAMSTFLGYPIRRGDVIGVQDPDGVLCGLLTRYESDASDGSYLVHVYGDVLPDLPDEGAESGDILTFFINGKPATLTGGPGTWESPGFFEFPVSSTTNDFEAVKVTGPADVSALEGATVNLDFTVTNQGNHADGFTLSALSDNGWTVSLPGGAASGSLNPGASITVTVRVVVPSPLSAVIDDDVYLLATSQANSIIKGVDYSNIEAGPSGILEDNAGVPGTYFLAQNYPNPFNPSTEISFGLEVGGHTTVTVYNLLGHRVSQVLDEYRVAGRHTVSWNGTDSYGQAVPSGIYFYRVSANEFVQTRKMVLMK
jgi:hypothetical protein